MSGSQPDHHQIELERSRTAELARRRLRETIAALGHAAPSTTQDVYVGRRVASSDAAKVLDR